MNFHENPAEHYWFYDFHWKSCSLDLARKSRIRPRIDRHFDEFLALRAMFHYYMTRRAVSLKSNTVPRTNWRPVAAQKMCAWGPVKWIFLIQSVVYISCAYFSRERICIRIVFLKRWASELNLVQSYCGPTDLQKRHFLWKIFWSSRGIDFS